MPSSAVMMHLRKMSPLIGQTVPEPRYASHGAAGLDLAACLESPVTIEPGSRAMIPTGLAVELPLREFVGLVFARSGLAARQGLCLANGVGVIDSDYRGEIICPIINLGSAAVTIYPGDRVAQMVVMPVTTVNIKWVNELGVTARGQAGFGSTGI